MKTNKKRLEPAVIGIFVVLSLLLLMTGIVLFGGSRFFEKENLAIAYFDDSLKGLSVGAPVTYRGVTIGQVKEVQMRILENGNREHDVIIPIIIALNGGNNLVVQGPGINGEREVDEFLAAMCRQGLRAKLKTTSLLTGKRYIDLAMYKDSEPVYRDTSGKYVEIPTLPSDMHQAQKIVENMDFVKLYDKVLGTFESLDVLGKSLSSSLSQERTTAIMEELTQITKNLNTILVQLDTAVGPLLEKVDGGLEKISSTADSADQLIKSLDGAVGPLQSDFTNSLHNLDHTLQQANQLLNQAERTLEPSSPLYYRLNDTLNQFSQTSKSIKKLSDYLLRNPDALIFGLQQTGEKDETE